MDGTSVRRDPALNAINLLILAAIGDCGRMPSGDG
jgi:hypothetical protein